MRVESHSGGCLVMVVGPSGSGKDTLLDCARERLASDPSFRFVRRVITRPVAAGEAHEPVTAQEFERRANSGAFALHWQAHGLCYGVSAVIMEWIDEGYVVVANGSRGIVKEARSRFPALHVVNVTAPCSVLAERLLARGRESSEVIVDRLARARAFALDDQAAYEIDNSGSSEQGGAALVRILRSIKALGR
jgi:ribose 1,5-bisphosphokinase